MPIHKKETKQITREMYFLKSPFLFNTAHQNEENTAFFIIWYFHGKVHPAWISIPYTSKLFVSNISDVALATHEVHALPVH